MQDFADNTEGHFSPPRLTMAQERILKQKLWLDKLKKLEETGSWFEQHPLLPEYKPRLSEPSPFWLVFFRQKQAFECTTAHPENVHVFAFEPDDQKTKSSPGKGHRKFLVTSYAQLWHTVRFLAQRGKHASFYEVIPEGAACKLYFDLEFSKDLNPDRNGSEMVQTLIQFVIHELKSVFSIQCNEGHVINLDASTGSKFSRHLIFNLPSAVFKDNIHAGRFVRHVCERIESLTSAPSSVSITSASPSTPASESTEAETDKQTDTCNHVDGEPRPKKARSECVAVGGEYADREKLHDLYIKTTDGQDLLIDMAVYTRNRNFRLYKCVKLGKENPLLVAPDNHYHVKTSSKGRSGGHLGEERQLFLDSLISNVGFLPSTKILQFGDDDQPSSGSAREQLKDKPATEPEGDAAQNLEGYKTSPFPEVDSFVSGCISKGGVAGEIRRWTYFSQAQLLVYDIAKNRWCENIGRQHKSNNIMILVDLRRGVYYQKCHDPACRTRGYKSEERHVPPQNLPSFTEWDDEELVALADQVEQEATNQKTGGETNIKVSINMDEEAAMESNSNGHGMTRKWSSDGRGAGCKTTSDDDDDDNLWDKSITDEELMLSFGD